MAYERDALGDAEDDELGPLHRREPLAYASADLITVSFATCMS